MKRAVVSFANGSYLPKLERMKESMKGNTDADIITFTKYEEVGCKPHTEIPYQFKPYAIWKAIGMGYDSILWVDSPIVAVKDITPVFEHIEKNRYVFFNNIGHPLGKWTNQKCLDYFGMTREQSMNIKQIMASCMGFSTLDRTYQRWCIPFIDKWLIEYKDLSDQLYPGSWTDHRHDQTVMSFLINRYGLDILTAHETFFSYTHFSQHFKISDSVCLISK
jgi:hypothetical protein